MIDHLGIADRWATTAAVQLRDRAAAALEYDVEIVFGRYRGQLDTHDDAVECRRKVIRSMAELDPTMIQDDIAAACGVDRSMVTHALNPDSHEKHKQRSRERAAREEAA